MVNMGTKMKKLLEIVDDLAAYDDELTIYACKPWSCDSVAIVAREPDAGGLPPEAVSCGAEYFIEIFVAKEFLEGWVSNESAPPTVNAQCDRLIHYAEFDA